MMNDRAPRDAEVMYLRVRFPQARMWPVEIWRIVHWRCKPLLYVPPYQTCSVFLFFFFLGGGYSRSLKKLNPRRDVILWPLFCQMFSWSLQLGLVTVSLWQHFACWRWILQSTTVLDQMLLVTLRTPIYTLLRGWCSLWRAYAHYFITSVPRRDHLPLSKTYLWWWNGVLRHSPLAIDRWSLPLRRCKPIDREQRASCDFNRPVYPDI